MNPPGRPGRWISEVGFARDGRLLGSRSHGYRITITPKGRRIRETQFRVKSSAPFPSAIVVFRPVPTNCQGLLDGSNRNARFTH